MRASARVTRGTVTPGRGTALRVGAKSSARVPKPAGAPYGRRGALLLEIVIALAVLVGALGLLGSQLARGLDVAFESEERLRSELLMDQMLALVQLDPEIQQRVREAERVEDEFGDAYPGYFWRVQRTPVDEQDAEGMQLVTVEVLWERGATRADSASIGSAEVVRRVGYLVAPPAKIDLVSEAGLSEEMADQLRQLIPLPDFDPRAIDLQQLMAMLDPEMLQLIMSQLQPLLAQLGAGGLPSGMGGLPGGLPGGGMPGNFDGMSEDELAEFIRRAVEEAEGQAPGMLPEAPGGGMAPPAIQGQPGQRGNRGAPAPPGGGAAAGGQRGPQRPGQQLPPQPSPRPQRGGNQPIEIGEGSGPNGEYTIEDLMRLRDEYERQQRGG